MLRSRRRSVIAVGAFMLATSLGLGISAGPAFADEPTTESSPPASAAGVDDPLPDLQVSLAFDKPSYKPSDAIAGTLIVVNAGSATATHVKVFSVGGSVVVADWGPLISPGVRLEPNERVELALSARLGDVDADQLARLTVEIRANEQDANPVDNTAEATAAITVVRGTVTGVAYADRNGNDAMDPGEQSSDLLVHADGGTPHILANQVTDAHGRFTFRELPAGDYFVHAVADAGWWQPLLSVTVDGVDDPDVRLAAYPAMSESVTVTMAFANGTYALGDVARLTMRFTNSGSVPFRRVTALWLGGDSSTPGWGDLADGGPGVTIPAHSTVMVDVSITVPIEAYRLGYLTVATLFAPSAQSGNSTRADARVRVTGGIAPRIVGTLLRPLGPIIWHPPPSEPVPDTKVYIQDEVSGAVVARAVTDAHGMFVFADIPAGPYKFGVVGPWRILTSRDETPQLQVFADENDADSGLGHQYFVVPGADQPDPDAVPSPMPQPGVEPAETSNTTKDALASTGANVLWLTIGGLLSLAVGVGLVLRRGRRFRV